MTVVNPLEQAVPPRAKRVRYVRDSIDLLRMLVGVGVLVVAWVLLYLFPDTLFGLEADLAAFFAGLPASVFFFAVLGVLLVSLAMPVVIAVLLAAFRYWRGLVTVVTAGAAGYGVFRLAEIWLRPLLEEITERAPLIDADLAVTGEDLALAALLAALAAVLAAASPWMTRRWRAAVWTLYALAGVVSVLSSPDLALTTLLAFAVGWTVGVGVLLAFGVPMLQPDEWEVADELRYVGITPVEIKRPSVDARGSTPFFVTTDTGRRLFVKALSEENRSNDVLFRGIRRVRLRNVGDEKPFSSVRRMVEHEAMLALYAEDLGVRTPHMVTVSAPSANRTLIAYEILDGRSLDSVDPDDLTPEVLGGVWEQVRLLQEARVAHRDLRLANVFLDSEGRPWLIDFGFSEMSATDGMLGTDVAELLAATSTAIGVERAVAPAVEVLGPEAVARALPRLQPAALSTASRQALGANKGLTDALRLHLEEVTGHPEYEPDPIQRVTARQIFTWVMIGLAAYFIISQFSDLTGIIDAIQEANWGWAAVALVFSLLTYVAAAATLMSSVPNAIPYWPTLLQALAGSFVNRVTPAKVGGLALGARYLVKSGVEPAVAATGMGINTVVGMMTHIPLAITFLVISGQTVDRLPLPSGQTVLIIAAAVLAIVGVVLGVGAIRKRVLPVILPAIQKSLGGFKQILSRPSKIVTLFLSSTLVSLFYVGALEASVEAFGGGVPVAGVAVVFLVGGSLASFAPTPGGLGAVEAALVAGLTSFGMASEAAFAAVLLYRLVTFWIPVLPGWLAFRTLERREMI